jgi:hypothetical protein
VATTALDGDGGHVPKVLHQGRVGHHAAFAHRPTSAGTTENIGNGVSAGAARRARGGGATARAVAHAPAALCFESCSTFGSSRHGSVTGGRQRCDHRSPTVRVQSRCAAVRAGTS